MSLFTILHITFWPGFSVNVEPKSFSPSKHSRLSWVYPVAPVSANVYSLLDTTVGLASYVVTLSTVLPAPKERVVSVKVIPKSEIVAVPPLSLIASFRIFSVGAISLLVILQIAVPPLGTSTLEQFS